jgi:glycosyltransferase involved in cell wall biosynthesis
MGLREPRRAPGGVRVSGPYLSVIVPTMRLGGLDVLRHGLAGQTFRDFELVLSDGLYDWRKVHERVHPEFPTQHVRPRGHRFPRNEYCRVMNEALVAAGGEVALLLSDYTWLPPDALERHAAHHLEHGPRAGLMGFHSYRAMPKLHPDFRPYREDEIERYVGDVATRRFLWSVFDKPYDFDARELALDGYATDEKSRMPAGPVAQAYMYCKNESIRLEHLLDLNGFDEDLDGSHGYQDSDIADRLVQKCGVQWVLDPTLEACIVNPRRVFPRGVIARPHADNERRWHAKRAAGYPTPNAWSLREARAC